MKSKLLSVLAVSLLAGCFTLSESEFPQVSVPKVPSCREIKLQLAGFEAAMTSYVPIYGYETHMTGYWGGGWYGPGYYCYPSTVAVTSYVPQVSPDKTFITRASDTLERAGFLLHSNVPDYRAEVQFTGPYESSSESAKNIAWNICTIFTADRVARTWNARLKIYDAKTGKLLESRDFSQEYYVFVWGPIPFFSPLSSEKTNFNYSQSWALTALTDMAIAEISEFLTKQTH